MRLKPALFRIPEIIVQVLYIYFKVSFIGLTTFGPYRGCGAAMCALMITQLYNYCAPERRCNEDRAEFLATLLACKTWRREAWSIPFEAGKPAPDVQLLDQHRKTDSMADYRGRWLVAYFYPKGYLILVLLSVLCYAHRSPARFGSLRVAGDRRRCPHRTSRPDCDI